MYCCFEKKSGFLATFIWDLIWMGVDFVLLVLLIVSNGLNFHRFRMPEVLLALIGFTFVSLVRPMLYFITKKDNFSNISINFVCLLRFMTVIVWLCFFGLEVVMVQYSVDQANRLNERAEYHPDYDPPDNLDTRLKI